MNQTESLNSPTRYKEIQATIERKPSLKLLYVEDYLKFAECLTKCPKDGLALEIGSGGGFLKNYIPNLTSSDIIPYEGVDQVVDATNLPFKDNSLRAIFLHYVLHHINNADLFFKEAQRCLKPGGRIFIIDPHKGLLSRILYSFHHEPFRPNSKSWTFPSQGPLSDANAALAWIIFQRDKKLFESQYPSLEILYYQPHSPLRYWLTGGMKKWVLLPGFLFFIATQFDNLLTCISREFCTFTDIEIVKK
ncbi:MAG: hypothetical protein A2381_00875 [Bdellovibrionales bacterium RIFOXYB1_FULL_37_110]|nr:MAG: hypothetical protein A2417_01730 [Bdellovibrionales bacterium RIFOXYC1_FULL_37_79]OFZ58773.1 MAG: hypothetical protein A2381_00875 [Bdellovibrionales bacterium RIFOXYB1_FULL_37_110]OFZ59199.1 MAG: hypothetical protein A2328_08530 [Bdellovibrionales bacterium RIFOXYB2_FULL_36_6]OFZ64772.1 MAG: hypothetical protein A2577_06875 [Bdellovibrionales bacterium RIFOXYD1_FULL_36_51]